MQQNQRLKLKVGRFVKIYVGKQLGTQNGESVIYYEKHGVITHIPKHKKFYTVGILKVDGTIAYKRAFGWDELTPIHKHEVPKKDKWIYPTL